MLYFAVLLCCGMFYTASGNWLASMLLAVVLGLPWFSLLLSLPGLLTFRLSIQGDSRLAQGETGYAWLAGSCTFPTLPFGGKLKLRNKITGEETWYHPDQCLPSAHCGGYQITAVRCRVWDYLCLLSFPAKKEGEKTLLVCPRPLPIPGFSGFKRSLPSTWRPKAGGGFGENHELRLYRPGDSLNQIHWKITAKTGKLTVREPMVPHRGLVLLTMTLRGTPEQRDRKFGRLLWLGETLLSQEVPFTLRVLTGDGVRSFPIAESHALTKTIDTLLCTSQAEAGSIRDRSYAAFWQYHIGGAADES